jgi:hypothetical protein
VLATFLEEVSLGVRPSLDNQALGIPLHRSETFASISLLMVCTLQIASCCRLSHIADGCTR